MLNQIIEPWLKSMQNGGIGEARTKSLLMDRFWILERSVDIDGADFLIQRRLNNKNILDYNFSLGVVQVKFYQDKSTTQHIAKSYVFNSMEIRKEFFLIIHTGMEENKKIYFLTSEDISTFSLNSDNKYKISGTKVLIDQFDYTNRTKELLDKIEIVLETTEFKKNRLNLEYFLNIQINENDILKDFDFPISNSILNIKETFFEYKEKIRTELWNLEDIINEYQKAINTNNPREFYNKVIEDIHEDYPNIDIELKNLSHEDFYNAIEEHENKLRKLKSLNKDKEYLTIYKILSQELQNNKDKIDIDKKFINFKINVKEKTINILSEEKQLSDYQSLDTKYVKKVKKVIETISVHIQNKLYDYLTNS